MFPIAYAKSLEYLVTRLHTMPDDHTSDTQEEGERLEEPNTFGRPSEVPKGNVVTEIFCVTLVASLSNA